MLALSTHIMLALLRAWQCRRMWQFALNAVLFDLRGGKDVVRWHDAATLASMKRQYTLLYCKLIKQEGTGSLKHLVGDCCTLHAACIELQ
jgi:hypothetical protein